MPSNFAPSPKIIKHLERDPVLALVIKRLPPPSLKITSDHFCKLVEAIISQQLSDKAATTINNRFKQLFPGASPTPALVLSLPIATIRGAGISGSKVGYIRGLAEAFQNKEIDPTAFHSLEDEIIIEQLTQIKGIGRWTAEMFLIFSLGRENIFSRGDGGLQRAIRQLYKLRGAPSPRKLKELIARWHPYASYACLYLWASLSEK